MYFKREITVRELRLGLAEGETIEFDYDVPHNVRVSLRTHTAEETQSGHKRENAVCTAKCHFEPNARIRSMFESLAEGILPEGSEKIDPRPDYIDESGRVKDNYVVPLAHLPSSFQDFMSGTQRELFDFAKRTVLVLRWKVGAKGQPHVPFAIRSDEWSFDGQVWHPSPHSLGGRLEMLLELRVSEDTQKQVKELVASGETEPVGHELHREAWSQRGTNPRSSLVIGIAAAEVGFKKYVSTIAPNAAWLVENAASPPLVTMLREYLPSLPARNRIANGVLSPPSDLLDVLKKGVTIRNQIVHGRDYSLSHETLEEILLAVHDVLWILDFYGGYEWALGFVRDETRQRLEDH